MGKAGQKECGAGVPFSLGKIRKNESGRPPPRQVGGKLERDKNKRKRGTDR